MSNKPVYKAISYAWGEPVFPRTLHLPQGQVAITECLFGALQRFRSTTEPQRLWADAVCINQGRTVEKNHQVADMHEIYEQAEEGLVWLGSAKSDCLVYYLLSALADLPDTIPWPKEGLLIHQKVLRSSVQSPESETCGQCYKPFGIEGAATCREAIRSFTKRPWFSRLWVIQEIFCAKHYTVHFGHHYVHSRTLERANNRFYYPGFCLTEETIRRGPVDKLFPVLPILNITTYYRQNHSKPYLLGMIFKTQHTVSKIPHDIVFAVRRLANVQSLELLAPDYGLAIEDLWKRVAMVELCAPIDDVEESRHFRSFSRVAVLALAGVQKKWYQAHEPSWVPDFANLTYDCQAKWSSYEVGSSYKTPNECWAGGKSVNSTTIDESLNVISIRGKPLDHVKAICTRPHTSKYCPVIPDSNELIPWLARSRTGLISVNVITLS